MRSNLIVTQVNLQKHFGGGETFTRFFTAALINLGYRTEIIIDSQASFWTSLVAKQLKVDVLTLPEWSRRNKNQSVNVNRLFLGHGPVPTEIRKLALDNGASVVAIAHMPPQGRRQGAYDGHDLVAGVSEWVVSGLKREGVHLYEDPLYGVSDTHPRSDFVGIKQSSRYAWDRRKFRDRILGIFEPLWRLPIKKTKFYKRPGLTLGLVSGITPIKQFPQLFKIISPVIASFPGVYLEVFGAGGYASIRDLDKALLPIKSKVRFWGRQGDVSACYAQIDYLLTGLPEKEALGLNVIEAQSCNLPVLAVDAPPFTETILHSKTGYLYTDPRKDNGNDFKRLLEELLVSKKKIEPKYEIHHLARFSEQAFEQRVDKFIQRCLTLSSTPLPPQKSAESVTSLNTDLP